MNPAFSVVLLTTLIGVGQGLLLAMFTAESYAAFGLLPAQAGRFYVVGAALSLAFLVAGLAASFFHLGHPERAWRAAAQWRTSWLSREVIVLPALIGMIALYGVSHVDGARVNLGYLPGGIAVTGSLLLGVAATVLCFALFVCTAMIYACLRFLREWRSPLTVINYLLIGTASGFTFAAAYATMAATALVAFFAGWAAVLTAAALVTRAASLVRNARLRSTSTIQTAIGVRHPRIVQQTAGFMGGSFNTREFFHRRPASWMRSLKWLFIGAGFLAPLAMLAMALATDQTAWLPAAFAVQYLGLLAERWFFFAQANHPQNLYYQAVA